MPLKSEVAERLDQAVNARVSELSVLSRNLHENPELRFEEHRASAWISELVEREGRACVRGLGGLETAFESRVGRGSECCVAILAEYDALPELGHACGHNLIATAAVGAYLAAATELESLGGGELRLVGTPAEEGGGGKIRLLEAGAFQGVGAALMFHPLDRDVLVHPTLASKWIEFRFSGTPAHAAFAPHEGKSALVACMDAFRLVDGQRFRFRDGSRVHGFIKDGGQVSNVIVETATCEFNVRATTGEELLRLVALVERCARAAAMASEVALEVTFRGGYREMRNNRCMARVFGAHLEALGRKAKEIDPELGLASTDMGDLSQATAAIHPWLAIADRGTTMCHHHTFREAAGCPRGLETALLAAKAMARTAVELLSDRALYEEVRREFEALSP